MARGSSSGRSSRTWRSKRRPPWSSTADPAVCASTRVPRARSTSPASSTRRVASRTGRKLRSRSRSSTEPTSARRCTGATSARTSARGTAAIERRRASGAPSADSLPTVSLRDWLERDGDDLVAELDRLYVPRKDPRWLRRNALVAAGNVGTDELVPSIQAHASGPDPMLSETAAWALERIAARTT